MKVFTTICFAKDTPTGSLPPVVPLAITHHTYTPKGPWTHASDDRYIYQLSLDLATATLSSPQIVASRYGVAWLVEVKKTFHMLPNSCRNCNNLLHSLHTRRRGAPRLFKGINWEIDVGSRGLPWALVGSCVFPWASVGVQGWK